MLLRDRQFRVQVNQFVDGGVFAVALWLAWLVRTCCGRIGPGPFSDYFPLFLVVIPMTPLVLEWQGFYDRPTFSPVKDMLTQLARACAICVVGLILIAFLFKEQQVARGVLVLFGVSGFGLMFLKEELVRAGYRSQLGREQFRQRVIVAGAPKDINRLKAEIGKMTAELEIVAEFDLNSKPVEELVGMLHEHAVNAVVIAARHTFFDRVERTIRACELEGVEIWLLADFFETQISKTTLDRFYGRPVLVFHSGTDSTWPRLIKQIMDFLGALVALTLVSPVMLAAALAVKATSRGPVLFRQARAGLNGKPFIMYKFRSMVTNAEQLKQELERLNEMSGPVFKVTNDPRVTKVGHLLRKFSIDEFPQLFNVLRFEMSLVGPRPLPLDEVNRFDDMAHRRRLSVRPGLTCTWQVSGRNEVKDFKDWVKMDLDYIDNWSLWLDVKILWRTIWVVLLGWGAR